MAGGEEGFSGMSSRDVMVIIMTDTENKLVHPIPCQQSLLPISPLFVDAIPVFASPNELQRATYVSLPKGLRTKPLGYKDSTRTQLGLDGGRE